jgi:hypothetical protein
MSIKVSSRPEFKVKNVLVIIVVLAFFGVTKLVNY